MSDKELAEFGFEPDELDEFGFEEESPEAEAPLVTGLVEAVTSVPVIGPAVEAGAKGITELLGLDTPEAYEARREAARQANPAAATTGQIAGAVGGGLALPGALPAQVGISGADLALRGRDAEDIATTMGIETAAGLLLPKGIKALAKGGQKLAGKAGGTAEGLAETAMGLNRTKAMRQKLSEMVESGQIREGGIGRMALDRGVVGPKSQMSMAKQASNQIDQIGKEIQKTVASGKEIPIEKLKAGLNAELSKKGRKFTSLDKVESDALLKELGMADTQKIPGLPKEVSKILGPDGKPYVTPGTADEYIPITSKEAFKASEKLAENLGDKLPKSASGKARKAYKEVLDDALKDSISVEKFEELRKKLTDREAMRLAKGALENVAPEDAVSKLEKVVAGSAALSGNAAIPAAVATRGFWNKYGRQAAAAGIDKGSKMSKEMMSKLANAAEKGGTAGVQAVHLNELLTNEKERKKHMKDKED